MSESQHLAEVMEQPLNKVLRYLGQRRADASKARALTPSQFSAMRLLCVGGERRMSEVAVAMALSNSACTVMTDQLEKRDLVRKRMDADDRRAVLVAITSEGQRMLDEVISEIQQDLAARLDRLNPEERRMVAKGFEALARVID